jgi:hypothetical protein
LVNGAIPLIATALSITRIAACESKIAQYKAAAALPDFAVAMIFELLEMAILSKGAKRRGRNQK